MDIYFNGFSKAITLIFSGDKDLYEIVFRSLYVSGIAVAFASIIGIPLGTWLATRNFAFKNFLIRIIYVLMGLPPVLVGLFLFLLLSRSGPIAEYIYILFTPSAMIIAQFILALPIIIGLVYVTAVERGPIVFATTKGLGASHLQALFTLIMEIRFSIIVAVVTAFGRVIAEVGAVMLVGGDIEGSTRVLTTAIVLETRKGNFEMAIALGIILLLISFIVNSLLFSLQQGGKKDVNYF